MDSKRHWEKVYKTKPSDTVSWYQPQATLSLEIIARVARSSSSAIVDVGGGASCLVDDLLARGMTKLSVLDISAAALDVARRRLGEQSKGVQWIVDDITRHTFEAASIDVWHDRAVFHFLTKPDDRAAYVQQVRRAVRPGGHVIVAGFAPDGPLECSGLSVVRYGHEALHAEFGRSFELLEHLTERHVTPAGAVQQFVYCHCLLH